jgi:hypothetical protein
MAVNRSGNFVAQQRIDVPQILSIESAVRNDFDELLSSLVLGDQGDLIIRGFELNMTGSIGNAASALTMVVSDSAMLHGTSTTSGTFFVIRPGAANVSLNAVTNSNVIGSFAPNSNNYISLDLSRTIDSTTSAPVAIWDPTNQVEVSKILPLAQTLNFTINITTSTFAANTIPIAIVSTDVNNNVVYIEDQRNMLGRLGKAGLSTPNPFYVYPWTNQSEGRVENPPISYSSSVNPFEGGDKMIKNLKEWMDAIMSMLLEIKGTAFWYSIGTGGSTVNLRADAINTIVSSAGSMSHSSTTAGQINWSSDIQLRLLGSLVSYDILPNVSNTYITLVDQQVAYVNIVRDQSVTQPLIFTQGSPIVVSVANISWTTGLQAGDYIKVQGTNASGYYQILSVNSSYQITLTANFTGTTSPGSGVLALYSYGQYQAVATPSTNRHVWVANRTAAPNADNMFWLAMRDDNGGANPKVYTRFKAGELLQGESILIAGEVPNEVLVAMGLPNEKTSEPPYTTTVDTTFQPNSITPTDSFTGAISKLITNANTTSYAISYEQEDRSAYLRSDNTILWNGANLTFTSDIILEMVNSLSGIVEQHRIAASNSPIAIGNGQSIWATITRAPAGNTENLTIYNSGSTAIPAQSLTTDQVFVFFRAIEVGSITYLHIPFMKSLVNQGQSVRLGQSGGSGGTVTVNYFDPFSTVLPTGSSVMIDGVAGVNGNTVLYSNLLTGNNQIYELGGVGSSITWTPFAAFNGQLSPVQGNQVLVLDGLAYNNQFGEFDNVTWQFNDVNRYFNGSGDYWEGTSPRNATIVDNQSSPATIFSVTALGSENIKVNYSIIRGNLKETGQLFVTNNGLTAAVTSESATISSTGVTFQATLSAGDIVLSYTSTSLGQGGTMKYFVERWSDAPGTGPTGLPSYNMASTVPIGYLNAAYAQSDGSALASNCQEPTVVGGYTQLQLNFVYTMSVNAGSTAGDLEVIADGLVIPRYLAGVTTTAFYTEVNNTTIQFWANLTSPAISLEVRRKAGTIDTSSTFSAKFASVYDAVVGSLAQVATGVANYSSINAALTVAQPGWNILVLGGTYTENVTVSQEIVLMGKGSSTVINGNLEFTSGSARSLVTRFYINGSVQFDVGSLANYLETCWGSSGGSTTDSGTDNVYEIIRD